MQFGPHTNQQLLETFARQFSAFHQGLGNRHVKSKRLTVSSDLLPNNPTEFSELALCIDEQILPHLSASNGGRYWGFVTGGANPVATYADWLVTTYNQNVSKGGDSIATAVELQTLSWLCQLFDLPESFKGIVTTGATAANLLASFTARQFAGQQQGIDVAKQGMGLLDVSIFSATPHASMVKSLGMAGFGQNSWHKVACLPNSEAMDVKALAAALQASTAKSIIVIASAATVTGTDYDDLTAIAKLCQQHNAWLHIDAAFGIFERLLKGSQGKTKGIELADSITLDCHKWLNVPYDAGVFLTRHQDLLQQSCEVDAPYLVSDASEIAFMSLGIENSRRFRAFPIWATLKAFGKNGIKSNIQANVDHAAHFAAWVSNSSHFELIRPCELNVVLFKPHAQLGLGCQECMVKLNETGEVLFTPGIWNGEAIIRAAFSNWATTHGDIERVIHVMNTLFPE
jgi:glutamate/tyrosine decarboxylase-like PLP-dependent enzyme